MSIFSERLTALMKSKGFTQKEFAAEAKITESAISYYVNGTRTPSGDVLIRIAKALDTTTDYLLGGTDVTTITNENQELQYLQRNLRKLDSQKLKQAEDVLKIMFNDIFEDDDDA